MTALAVVFIWAENRSPDEYFLECFARIKNPSAGTRPTE